MGIHPNFTIPVGVLFQQNKAWNSVVNGKPEIKLVFCFNDPRLLDDCPFVTKIEFNRKGWRLYFGVAYAKKDDEERLMKWAKRFPEFKLITNIDIEFIRVS